MRVCYPGEEEIEMPPLYTVREASDPDTAGSFLALSFFPAAFILTLKENPQMTISHILYMYILKFPHQMS